MSAIETFRRAMRRHEKRARRQMGFDGPAEDFAYMRRNPDTEGTEQGFRNRARLLRRKGQLTRHACVKRRRLAWLYERAADAVARYRDAPPA